MRLVTDGSTRMRSDGVRTNRASCSVVRRSSGKAIDTPACKMRCDHVGHDVVIGAARPGARENGEGRPENLLQRGSEARRGIDDTRIAGPQQTTTMCDESIEGTFL